MGKKRKTGNEKKKDVKELNLEQGIMLYHNHPLFSKMNGHLFFRDDRTMGKNVPYSVEIYGAININKDCLLTPKQWAHGIAHCLLHLAFGHFDADKMPSKEVMKSDGSIEKIVDCNLRVWNHACDIYVEKFLADIKFGESLLTREEDKFSHKNMDELEMYEMLLNETNETRYGFLMDMIGLERPMVYGKNQVNRFTTAFSYALAASVSDAVNIAGGHEKRVGRFETKSEKAAKWFMNHYPLMGGLASSFRIIEDYRICQKEEIQIAAVDVSLGEIYINPSSGLSMEELKFVLAHEFLHAGLQHHQRCQGRDPYLWNVACDYVINGWLVDMQIGEMPEEGLLYDECLKDLSAETIYDMLLANLRGNKKLDTFRGYGKGDILERDGTDSGRVKSGVSLDEFWKSALTQGLEYHQSVKRGTIPAGLIEEIRALAMPVIPWDVELAQWFDRMFPDMEKKRTYARPSRRQGSTPDIARPRYVMDEKLAEGRTFGVVIDTSGSMSAKMIGMALGSIASYAASKEVPYVRVVFCDADAYDAGYLAPEEVAGRVEVKGRGGTILQPGVDLLEKAKDFPKDGPILIITDGEIEDKMKIHREHAFLIPKGKRLPFRAKGKVFRFN